MSINISSSLDATDPIVAEIVSTLKDLQTKVTVVMATLDDVKAQLDSLVGSLGQIATLVHDLVAAKDDPVKVQALFDEAKSGNDATAAILNSAAPSAPPTT